jgi:hypothetical protein
LPKDRGETSAKALGMGRTPHGRWIDFWMAGVSDSTESPSNSKEKHC